MIPSEALRAAHPFAALGFSRADTMAAGPGAGKTAAEVVWGSKMFRLSWGFLWFFGRNKEVVLSETPQEMTCKVSEMSCKDRHI